MEDEKQCGSVFEVKGIGGGVICLVFWAVMLRLLAVELR
jgi:hypothetical protein